MRIILLTTLLLLLAACAGPTDKEKSPRNKLDKYGRKPYLAAQYKSAVERKTILRGMHKDEIRQVMGSGPEKTRKGVVRNEAKYTVWAYGKRQLYFFLDRDGFLVFWEGPY